MKVFTALLIIAMVFGSCRKDDDDYHNVIKIPGIYYGESYYRYANSYSGLHKGFSISISENNQHSVKMSSWPTGAKQIIIEINHTDLSIINFVDTVISDPEFGAAYPSHISRINGTGTYEPIKKTIYIDYAEERASISEGEFKAHSDGYISLEKW